jgi:hypothetical protein
MLCVLYADVINKSIMLTVIMLNVVAPKYEDASTLCIMTLGLTSQNNVTQHRDTQVNGAQYESTVCWVSHYYCYAECHGAMTILWLLYWKWVVRKWQMTQLIHDSRVTCYNQKILLKQPGFKKQKVFFSKISKLKEKKLIILKLFWIRFDCMTCIFWSSNNIFWNFFIKFS